MEWSEIRALYVELFRASGRTQDQVAAAGGIAQNVVSKLLRNPKKGPITESFIKAVIGLGIPVSTFFAHLERQDADLDVPLKSLFAKSIPAAKSRTGTARHTVETALGMAKALAAFERIFLEQEPTPRSRPRKKVLANGREPL